MPEQGTRPSTAYRTFGQPNTPQPFPSAGVSTSMQTNMSDLHWIVMERAGKRLCACTAVVLLISGFTAMQASAASTAPVAPAPTTTADTPQYTETVISD